MRLLAVKRGMYFARVLSLIGLATAASVVLPSVSLAQVTNFTDFSVDIVMGRTAVLSSDGNTVLSSVSNLGTSRPGLLPLDFAQQIAADPRCLSPVYIQTNIENLVGSDDYDYLLAGESLSTTGALFNVDSIAVITSGDVFTNVANDLINSLPSAALTNQIFEIISLRNNHQYTFSGGNGATEIVAAVNVNFYEEDIMVSIPEPSSFLLLASGLAILACHGKRRR